MVKKGFSLLELVIAIFLIAVVIGTVLLLLAANLNIINKANELMIANALVQYSIEEVKNIDFPPIYADMQDRFGKEIENENIVDITQADTDAVFTPSGFTDKFEVRRYNISYFSDGTIVDTDPITKSQDTYNSESFLRKILVYVIRKRDKRLILKTSTFVSRNGLY